VKGMTPVVQNVSRLVAGFVILYAVYVVCTGHLAPGGGFAGGVILMAGVVMLVLAFGGDRARELMAENRCHVLDGSGALVFVLVALFGFFAGGFFKNFLDRGTAHEFLSGGTIMVCNLAIGLKVAAGLVGIFLALVLASRQAMPKE